MYVRAPQLTSTITVSSVTPVGPATGGSISARFKVELDPLIDEAYVEVVDSTGAVIGISSPDPVTAEANKARWKIDMMSASQFGQTFVFSYGNNREDLVIRIVDVKYNDTEYPLKSELFVKSLF